MLLQTLVQLNILILATPALAGWTLLPVHTQTFRAAGVVWQYRGAETIASQVTAPASPRQAVRLPAAAPCSAVLPVQPAVPAAYCAAAPASQHPLTHTARAP